MGIAVGIPIAEDYVPSGITSSVYGCVRFDDGVKKTG
jgi:hypothetical protein